MTYAPALLNSERLVHLAPVDLAIIAIYFLAVLGIGFYLKRFAKTGEDFFLAGREMTAWGSRTRFRFRQPRIAGTAGLGGVLLSIRNPRCPLVLDWRHSGNGVSRYRDDAVLLHFEDALCSGVSPTALWFRGQRVERRHLCHHDRSDVGRKYVRDGRRNEG